MEPLIQTAPDVYRWTAPQEGIPDLVGHAIVQAGGVLITDPPAKPGLAEAIRSLGKVEALFVTGAHHDRAAGALRAMVGMPDIYAPRRDMENLKAGGLLVDHGYVDGDILPGGWTALDFPKTGEFYPESGFFREADGTLILSDLVVAQGEKPLLYTEAFPADVDPALLRPYVERLVGLKPRRLLAGHGDDLCQGVEEFLKKLLS